MSNEMRFRHADAKRMASGPVLAATVIEIGDLLFYDTGDGTLKPASDLAFNTSLAQTKTDFAAAFAGVAMEASADGETGDVGFARAGVFEFDAAAATFNLFEQVQPADDGNQTLDNQTVEAGTDGAIGYVVKEYGSNTTRVLIELQVEEARGLS